MICNTTISLMQCHDEMSDKDEEVLKAIYFWFDGVLAIIIVCIGLVLNTIGTTILRINEDMKHPLTYLLSVLFMINTVFLLSQIVNIMYYDFRYENLSVLIPYLVYPIEKTSVSAIVFCIVSLAHQAYVMSSDPIEYQEISNSKGNRRKRTIFYTLPCILLASIINIPRWFSLNLRVDGHGYEIKNSEFKTKFEYVVFYENFFLNITTVFIPITLLVFFNWSVHNIIQERQKEINETLEMLGKRRSQEEYDISMQKITKLSRNKEATNTLILIIIIFMFCHLPRCFTKFYDGFYKPFGLKIFESVQRLLLSIYASSTPLIYIRRNKKFWNHFDEIFGFHRLCNWFKNTNHQNDPDVSTSFSITHTNDVQSHKDLCSISSCIFWNRCKCLCCDLG